MSHLSGDEEHPDSPSELRASLQAPAKLGASPKTPGGDVIAGVVDDQSTVDAVLRDLAEAGIEAGTVRVFSGEAGSEEMGNVGGEGVGGMMKRAVADYVGGAKDFTDRHRDEARLGHYVVLIPLSDAVTVDRASQILGAHGSHDIVGKFGDQYESLSDIPKNSAA